ncbi:MAG: thiopurine S-methyltransferase, partial [Myxococcota bacterium]
RYSADRVDIFVGDIFDLSASVLGPVDAIYDRAALVALPEEMRVRYTEHMMEITDRAAQLLLTFVYDQSVRPGPPFSVDIDEVQRAYGAYTISLLDTVEVDGGLKGEVAADKMVWSLT